MCKLSQLGCPGRYESVEIILVGKTFCGVVQGDGARLKTASNVVEQLKKPLLY